MADQPPSRPDPARKSPKRAREAAALRANLRKRKEQARARAALGPPATRDLPQRES